MYVTARSSMLESAVGADVTVDVNVAIASSGTQSFRPNIFAVITTPANTSVA